MKSLESTSLTVVSPTANHIGANGKWKKPTVYLPICACSHTEEEPRLASQKIAALLLKVKKKKKKKKVKLVCMFHYFLNTYKYRQDSVMIF